MLASLRTAPPLSPPLPHPLLLPPPVAVAAARTAVATQCAPFLLVIYSHLYVVSVLNVDSYNEYISTKSRREGTAHNREVRLKFTAGLRVDFARSRACYLFVFLGLIIRYFLVEMVLPELMP